MAGVGAAGGRLPPQRAPCSPPGPGHRGRPLRLCGPRPNWPRPRASAASCEPGSEATAWRRATGRGRRRSSSRPGFRPHHPLAAPRSAPAGRLQRAGAGLAAARTRQRPPGWRSPAPTARPPPSRCWPRSCARRGCAPTALGNIGVPLVTATPQRRDQLRRAGRGAVQLPAALVQTLAPRWARCSTSPTTTWSGTAASTPTRRPRRGSGGRPWAAGSPSATSTTRRSPGVGRGYSARTVGWTLGAPAPGQFGVVDGDAGRSQSVSGI